MADAIAIRPARAEDLEALLDLLAQLHEQEPERLDDGPAVLKAILEQPSRHLLVATSAEGTAIGTADLLVVANLTHGARPWAIIENVVVDAGHRRCGAGARLMLALVEIARAAGCYRVLVPSNKTREEAHAFYRSLGFEDLAAGFKLYLS